ncbi:hypothetical protein L2E82_32933 [Cichorium intybus]|uniref:Uncharacterized protein n=1 Tax=Cichorium intybus TaxID=13427 RepID=A0ACB9BIM1_CICIN|nr:hypothetical protein L2E82_32933 [Cichorium intybus]
MANDALRTGFMTVFVVSGSVVLLAHQFHKHLLSDFMKKMEFELGPTKSQTKKKVRFSDEASKVLSANKQNQCPKEAMVAMDSCGDKKKCRKTMPLNWQVMYKGIIDYRNSIYIQ